MRAFHALDDTFTAGEMSDSGLSIVDCHLGLACTLLVLFVQDIVFRHAAPQLEYTAQQLYNIKITDVPAKTQVNKKNSELVTQKFQLL
jgi:hypothetical protein